MQEELEEIQHLSVTSLEQAFRLVENRDLLEILPEELENLTWKQWESIVYLLFLLRSAQMRSLIH
jgi:hypothetical protein